MLSNNIKEVLDKTLSLTNQNLTLYTGMHDVMLSDETSVNVPVYDSDGNVSYASTYSLRYLKSCIDRIEQTLTPKGSSSFKWALPGGEYTELTMRQFDIPSSSSCEVGNISYSASDAEEPYSHIFPDRPVTITLTSDNDASMCWFRIIACKVETSKVSQIATATRNKTATEIKAVLTNKGMTSYDYMTSVVSTEMLRDESEGNIVIDISNDPSTGSRLYHLDALSIYSTNGTVLHNLAEGDTLLVYDSDDHVTDTMVKVTGISASSKAVTLSYVTGYKAITKGVHLFWKDTSKTSYNYPMRLSSNYMYWIFVYKPSVNDGAIYQSSLKTADLVITPSPKLSSTGTIMNNFIDDLTMNNLPSAAKWRTLSNTLGVISDAASSCTFSLCNALDTVQSMSIETARSIAYNIHSNEALIDVYLDRINTLNNMLISSDSESSAGVSKDSVSSLLVEYKNAIASCRNSIKSLNMNLNDTLNVLSYDVYEARGYIILPAPKDNVSCIGLEVRYRYYSDTSTEDQSTSYTINGKRCTASIWNYLPVKMLDREYTGSKYKWSSTESEVSSVIIPARIRQNIAISYRYIYDAGYPANPGKSSWSPAVTVAWDSSLEDRSTNALRQKVTSSEISSSVADELLSIGMTQHVSDSRVTTSNTYFSHTAESIDSAQQDSDGKPLTVRQVLDSYKSLMTEAQQAITAVENRATALETTTGSHTDSIEAIQGELKSIEDTTQTLTTSVTTLTTSVTTLSNSLSTLNTALTALQTTVNTLQK